MDVKCEQCGAEYEFDESLLGDTGTTVKCAACSHVFRVMPRQKDDGRSALKLRYVRTGRVETLGSLRDLQQRIRNGEASIDDQIGRDGFPFLRLGDVPELRNFFSQRSGAAASSVRPEAFDRTGPALAAQPPRAGFSAPPSNHLPVSPTSMSPPNDPPRGNPQGGRTVLGVGPHNAQLPTTPRPAASPATPPAGMRGNGMAATQPGRAPISDAPTAQRPLLRTDDPSVSQAPTLPGTPGMDLRSQAARSVSHPPAAPRLSGPAPTHSNPVRLHLDEDERAPSRATGGSNVWLYAVVLLVLGGGGWLAINMLSGKKPAAEAAPPASRVEIPTPSPSVTPTPEAPTAATGTPAAPGSTPAPGATTAPGGTTAQPAAPATPTPPAAQPEPAAEPEPEKPAEPAHASGGGSKRPSGGGDSGKAPTDYGGWVQSGDRAFSRGELEQARTAYQNALNMRGTGSEANTGLGFTLLAEGKAKDAIPHFDRAASSGYAEANIGLGDAYRRLGQKSQAVEAYKEYLSRLPGGSRASYAKAQLTALGAGESAEKPEAPQGGGNSEYRPAGELEPAPEPSAPAGEGAP